MAQKSRTRAAVFAFALGALGIHDFYLGYTKKAILHLVLYIVNMIFGFICIIPYIGWILCFVAVIPMAAANSAWCVVEGIKILSNKDFVDGHGNPLI